MLIVKYAASWVSETSWDVEFSVHVFSWEVFWLCEVTGCCSLRWLRPFSAVLTLIASLSFLFRSQPCISPGLFPSFPGGGWALHLQSVQSGCCCFCCLFNRPDYRNCLQSGGCLCIPSDIQLLPGFACLYPEWKDTVTVVCFLHGLCCQVTSALSEPIYFEGPSLSIVQGQFYSLLWCLFGSCQIKKEEWVCGVQLLCRLWDGASWRWWVACAFKKKSCYAFFRRAEACSQCCECDPRKGRGKLLLGTKCFCTLTIWHFWQGASVGCTMDFSLLSCLSKHMLLSKTQRVQMRMCFCWVAFDP